jgi:hypothetical protein
MLAEPGKALLTAWQMWIIVMVPGQAFAGGHVIICVLQDKRMNK